jgi:hypothetical protein
MLLVQCCHRYSIAAASFQLARGGTPSTEARLRNFSQTRSTLLASAAVGHTLVTSSGCLMTGLSSLSKMFALSPTQQVCDDNFEPPTAAIM